MNTPKHIFHYTQINSLALILANKTIRFTALNSVNDLIEGKSSDMDDLGMYLYVSCWTDLDKEHLPLWNMYTPNMRGVRIKLPFPIFPIYKKGKFFREEDLIHETYMILSNREPFRRVIYTNDQNKLRPKLIVNMGNGFEGINLDKVGLYKDEIWGFENEIRFFFSIFPKPKTKNIHDSFDIDELTKLIDRRAPLGFNYYDLKISDTSFKNMEITLGPKTMPGDKEIVESLVKKYNPTAKVHISKLTNKIR